MLVPIINRIDIMGSVRSSFSEMNGMERATGSSIVGNTVDNRQLKKETFLVVEIRFVLAMRSPQSITVYIIFEYPSLCCDLSHFLHYQVFSVFITSLFSRILLEIPSETTPTKIQCYIINILQIPLSNRVDFWTTPTRVPAVPLEN